VCYCSPSTSCITSYTFIKNTKAIWNKVCQFIPIKKLSYTWQHKDVPGFSETVVTWELNEIGANKTRVKLIHSGFTGREERKSFKEHDQGWKNIVRENEIRMSDFNCSSFNWIYFFCVSDCH